MCDSKLLHFCVTDLRNRKVGIITVTTSQVLAMIKHILLVKHLVIAHRINFE